MEKRIGEMNEGELKEIIIKLQGEDYEYGKKIERLEREKEELKEQLEYKRRIEEYLNELKTHWLENDIVLGIIDELLEVLKGKNTSKERLKEYIKEDTIYNEYLEKNTSYVSDFDKFCIEHCQDIKNILEENEKLKKGFNEAIHKATEFESEVYELRADYGTKAQVERDMLLEENRVIKSRWNELRRSIKENINYIESQDYPDSYDINEKVVCKNILTKMEELEKGRSEKDE